jgi:hypothetical protein
MQRRVAAIYFVFFLVMGASAYSVIAVAEEPAIQVEGEPLGQGDTLTVDGRQYVLANLSTGSGENMSEASGVLTWTNESDQYNATIAINTATLQNGTTVSFNGSDATVAIPNVESPSNFSLVRNGNVTGTFAVNDSFTYQGNATTVVEVTPDGAQLAWGDDYRVLIPNESDPSSFRMVQQFNVTRRLAADPAVENQTITREDGQRYVVFASNGSTRPLGEYLPDPDVGQLQEGDTLTVRGNETTVANVTASNVLVTWTAPRTYETQLGEGTNVTLNEQQFVVHFEGDSVIVSPDVAKYQQELDRQDYFKERQNGLWGVTILSGLAAMFIIILAYLPVRG